MSKYLLSYDEADVEAGLLNVDSEGVLKGAGGGGGGIFVVEFERNADDAYVCKSTFAEIHAAFEAKQFIFALVSGYFCPWYLASCGSDCIDFYMMTGSNDTPPKARMWNDGEISVG